MVVDRVTTYKIFIGNIAAGTTNDEVRKIFEEYGTVAECDCLENIAFVHMEDDIEGKHAVEQLQGRMLNGNLLKIEESRRKKGDHVKLPTVKLLVKNVSTTVDARGLRNMFKRFGIVVEVELENGEGHVCIEATGDIGSAIKEMNGFVMADQAISVEPCPNHSTNNAGTGSARNDKNKQPQKKIPWANKYKFDDYTDSYEGDGYYNDDYSDYSAEPSPWTFDMPPQMPQSFHPPPEKILRDPLSRPRGPKFNQRFPGPRAFGDGPPPFGMRGRGPRPGMFPPPPMGFGMRPRGPPPSMRIPRNSHDLPYQQQHANPFEPNPFDQNPYHQQPEAFYEDDDTIVSIPRDRAASLPFVSGANTMPIGGGGGGGDSFEAYRVPRNSVGLVGRVKRGGGRGRNQWRGKPPKFTAVTHEIAPGEKFPVPPLNNPSFRAPLKWPKETVKKKVKKIKKPLVPAELPDYSQPVPELPNPTIPKGAVLKPFPPPASSAQQGDNRCIGSGSSQIDFTSDEY